MNIITLIIASAALLVSAANFYTLRSMSKDAASAPNAGTLGAGGGGRR